MNTGTEAPDCLAYALPVDDDRLATLHPQRHVEDRSALGHVDLVAAEIASTRDGRPDSSASARRSGSV